MINATNIAQAAVNAVERILDRRIETTPVRSMVVMSQPDLSGDADSVREWFAKASADTAAAAWLHHAQAHLNAVHELRRLANSDEPGAAGAREMVEDFAAFVRENLRDSTADEVIEVGEVLSRAGWKLTP